MNHISIWILYQLKKEVLVKIKITQCSLNSWYKERTGKIFDVIKIEPHCAEVQVGKKINYNAHFYVLDEDYIIIKERGKKYFNGSRTIIREDFYSRSLGYEVRGFENVYDQYWDPLREDW